MTYAHFSRLPLSTKISVPFLLLFVCMSFYGTAVFGRWLSANLEESARSKIEGLAALILSNSQSEEQHLELEAQLVADSDTVRYALASGDTAALTKVLLPTKALAGLSFVKVVDASGHSLVDLRDRWMVGARLADNAAVQQILAGLSLTSMIPAETQGATILAGVAPIRSGDGLLGGVIVGTVVDDDFVRKISAGTGEQLIAYRGSELIATTLPEARGAVWELPGPGQPATRTTIGTSQYLAKRIDLEPTGDPSGLTLMVLDSPDALDSAMRLLWVRLGAYFLLGILVAGIIGPKVARTITRPLETLTRATERLASGDLSVRSTVTTQDEVGDLSHAFNAMGEQLEERDRSLSTALRELEHRQQELLALNQEARYLADHDPVTGLLNHRAFHQRLEQETKRAQRGFQEFSVIMMDLDNFKLFNDTYGHPAGDRVLREIASVLSETVRASDVLGRYGGDEFVAVIPETGAEGAIRMAERVRLAMAGHAFVPRNGQAVPIQMSFGIAAYPRDGQSSHELISCADVNLYRSKLHGGDLITSGQDSVYEATDVGAFGVMDGLVTAVDNKDHYTRQHSEQVTSYAMMIAEELGLSEDTQRTLRIAGLLHDVGKIGVPDRILRKPGNLTEEEREVIKQHARLGEMIIKEVPNIADVLAAVGAHHERIDGQGYPRGLRGDEIPLLGRILAVADTYSAMTSDRPYRKAMASEQARIELVKAAGSQLDPELVRLFLEHEDNEIGEASVTLT